jgi:hypothetical protein
MSDYSQASPQKGLLERLLDEAESVAQSPVHGEESVDRHPPSEMTPPLSQIPTASPQGPPSMPGELLLNPAFLTALPSLMENLAPLLGGGSREPSAPTGTRPSPAIHPHRLDRHTALLCAIKPYLSPSRQETAETVIRLCRIWDAVEKSGISLTGLLRMSDSAGGEEGKGGDSRV